MGTVNKERNQLTPEEHRKNLLEILHNNRTGMLMTRSPEGRISGRPMGLARVDDDGTIYMTTGIDTPKAEELLSNSTASVTVQGHDGFAIIEGEATLSRDRVLIAELWKPDWKAWYPEGKDDPNIVIIILKPVEGTYWSAGLGHGLSYAYRVVKARVTGEEMDRKPDDMGKVDLRH